MTYFRALFRGLAPLTAFFAFALLLSGLLFVPSASAALTLTSGSNVTTTVSVATSVTGFRIEGPSASTTPVQLRVTSGSLSMTTTSGLTFDGASSGATVNFSGTVANINAALSTLKYTRGSTGTDTLEVSLVNRGEVFFTDNGHLYQFISGSFTWSAAKTAAEARTAYGAAGYLATITSSTENNFVYTRISGDGWLGATDALSEGAWKWATGPEAGSTFYNGVGGAGGAVVDGYFDGWANGEPNDYGVGEDCGYMYASQSGEWNDFPCSVGQGYVVEYGTPEALPTVVARNITIVTADVPAITTLSPTNGATSIHPNDNLVIGFSKTVSPNTGDILIKKSGDDSLAESIAVGSGQVTGGGTTSITINPSVTLADTTRYYVLIPGTAFIDGSSNLFEGISSTSTWTFTTSDITPPSISSVSSTVSNSSTASLVWGTDEAASSKVVYGTTSAYGRTTSEADTSPRVTSHTVELTSLLSCTTYHYAVVSRDATLNGATSTRETFLTTGCLADTSPTTATSTSIVASAGGTTSVTDSGSTLQVTAPGNFTASSSSVVIQVQAVSSDAVLGTIGRPTDVPNEVGPVVFDVKAIIDHITILDSFDQEVTITYQYADADVADLDESTLWLYHYHEGAWSRLNSCSLNTGSNTITCTTPSFSIFGLFGNEPVPVVSAGGGIPVIPVQPTAIDKVPLAFTINGGARTTRQRELTLGFNADPKTVTSFSASLDPMFRSASIWPLASNTFTLPDRIGNYTVYLRFYSTTGHASTTLSQTIAYDPSWTTGSPSTAPTSPSKPPAGARFTRTLKLGSKGEDVKALQAFLNARGFLVSKSGIGSPGQESSVYGTMTVAALKRFQEAYAQAVLVPLRLKTGTGTFGTSTLKFVNSLLNQK